MEATLRENISQLVGSAPVYLFMKGNPTFPQCGFSNQVVQILKAYDIEFGHFNVLEDPEVRQGIKEFSEWPTIPQLYINKEFIGGCDIVREAWESGELTEWLQGAFPEKTINAPKPPARPKNITPAEAQGLMGQGGYRFLDVRTHEERDIAKVDGFDLLDQELAQEILNSWDKETPMVFMCHFGGRSSQACEYFAGQGFQQVFNVDGGIDAWSETVDSSVPRY
ncbi:Grx4 family monothiol glutaredoxin [Acanthopleuribacter pedis]|uniref:Probable monothiol glutaredoxin 2 n=1 Tax=Acanthopleuribacter pedis TaxID=442870 RepID=A0A8J7PYC5_9BACT|nr:Grx4 family monothiol glutaredoxin [Acanthopleuribacter pedis]